MSQYVKWASEALGASVGGLSGMELANKFYDTSSNDGVGAKAQEMFKDYVRRAVREFR